jgi:hypothetical protein
MKFKDLLLEFGITTHVIDRLNTRFLSPDALDVVAIPKDGSYKRIVIGKYRITNEAKTQIRDIMSVITDPYYTAPNDISLIFLLQEFTLNRESVELLDPRYVAFFRDPQNYLVTLQEPPNTTGEPLSNGRYLLCVMKNNTLITIMLSRTKNPQLFKNTTGKVALITDVHTELDAYIDLDKLREKPLETPDEEPQAPPMSDRERRLQAYKDRQKKLYGGKK